MDADTGSRSYTTVHTSNDVDSYRPKSIARKPVNTVYQRIEERPASESWRTDYEEDDAGTVPLTHGRMSKPFDVSYETPGDNEYLNSPVRDRGRIHEAEKVSVGELCVQCVIHLLPVLVTALLLVLNKMNVYWRDVDATGMQNVILQAFQFPVKAHELLMTASIAAIVLHRVRYDLLVRKDLPLGFLTSPYRIGEIRYLFSHEFTGATTNRTSVRQSTMALLIVVGTIISLLVGPSSGVLMIPKLNWWNVKSPFGTATESIWYNTTRAKHWPAVMPNYTCGSWGCPNGGVTDLAVWGQNLGREHVTPQLTYFGGSSFHRVVTSNSTTYTDEWTATTSLMMRDAEAISSFWNYVVELQLDPAHLRRPRLSPKFVSGQDFLKPLVQVQCSAQPSGTATEYPHSSLRGAQPGMYDDVSWAIPNTLQSWTPNPIDAITFNLSSAPSTFTNAPTLVGLIHAFRSEDQQAMTIPCTILAHWMPASFWIDPKSDLNSHDSTQNPLQAFTLDTSNWTQITLSDPWLAMQRTAYFEAILAGMTWADSGMLRNGSEGLSWRLSTLLGLYVTDNIARYASDPATIVSRVGGDGSERVYSDIGILDYGPTNPPDRYASWSEYFGSEDLMQIRVEVDRYGYAWSFRGSLIKVAAVLLGGHAVLALGHLCVLVWRRWTSTAWGSVGSVVALALRSDVLKKVDLDGGTDDGGRKRRLWTVRVGAGRDRNGDLALVLGGREGNDHGEVSLVSVG